MGCGSVTSLHDFYHKRVINYHKNMEELCQQLDAEYEKLKEPILQQKQPDTLSVIRYTLTLNFLTNLFIVMINAVILRAWFVYFIIYISIICEVWNVEMNYIFYFYKGYIPMQILLRCVNLLVGQSQNSKKTVNTLYCLCKIHFINQSHHILEINLWHKMDVKLLKVLCDALFAMWMLIAGLKKNRLRYIFQSLMRLMK